MKTQIEQNGIVTLTDEATKSVSDSELWNDDLRPTTEKEHTWTGLNFATLWIGMCLCIPAYTMASGMISLGMNWWQAIGTIFLGNVIVLIPILLNSHAGTKFGIPYPVFARLWFGSKGAHIPSMARAVVAAGWFGINTWIGTTAIDVLLSASFPAWKNLTGHTAIIFALFWALNVGVAYKGPQAIKVLSLIAAPVVGLSALILMIWAFTNAGWGPILSTPSKFTTTGEFLKVFFPTLTGVIAFWATLALNIPDFCRYAKNQKSQMIAQSFSLPLTMSIFSFIGIAVTSATVVIFGTAIWDPVQLLAKFPPFIIFLGTIIIAMASLTINVGANIVAPARAIENLYPKRITFGIGALITGVFAILMQPWFIMSNFGNYIFGWLGTYAALLGPIDGIAIADYWLVRRRKMALKELYEPAGRYNYSSGFNKNGVYALIIGVAVPVLGLLVPGLRFLWDNAWTFGLFISMFAYAYLMKNDQSVLSPGEYEAITQIQAPDPMERLAK
ncbi:MULTISPECIES: NCS1 family nucleobase:cation symporter-1 [Fictibacillus]|uniref:Nitrate reductase n=1 Tax=Fictibacillus enclensis TaxID=1017270 RepID=A0A0V8J212_9BACL|nr:MULTISPECIES: NCS1 family nucleobase:cation symporter-1 [Fictibacillus]KSU81062.1 nitrate reductase [Fictibacillus enclensis]RXZ00589.1 nitrate reductase [Fictibacillus sp. S7]SCC34668.1 nucleobase:cation symporter-1, NCS1 family [Fictibacillus enclensis]